MNREQKKLMRNNILQKRNSLTVEEINAAEKLIMDNLLKLKQFTQSENVFCYLSFRSEVPTSGIIDYCRQHDKNVYIPVCVTDTKEMVISLFDNEVSLVTSDYGVQEPSKETIKLADRSLLDTAIVPGAVFDARGYRIGYGAGYYDKFFSRTSQEIFKIAVAYSFQIVDKVPEDAFDIPVDCIVTEKDIIVCSRKI